MAEWFKRVLLGAEKWVTRVTGDLAGIMAPWMPWLFIALRRAWVPTLVALAAAVMFFVVPQSREVLHGLSEPLLTSIADFRSDAHRGSINVWAWSSYVATAVLLGLSVWYSARLLATVGGARGTPNALEEESSPAAHADLLRVITWYPRWLGAGVLAAAIGALIFANYTPQLSDWLALALAVVAVAGPWALAVGWWKRGHGQGPAWMWLAVGALAVLGAAAVLVAMHLKWPVRIWCLACSTLPAVLWLGLTERRSKLSRRASPSPDDPAAYRVFSNVIVTTVLMALSGTVTLLLLAWLPELLIRAFGSAATILVFLAASCAFASAGQLWLRFVASDIPGLTTATTAVVAVLVALVGQEGLGRESLPPPAAGPAALAPVAPASAASAASAQDVQVSAAGGGLRAALFTALVLAQADDASCGEFGRRLAAASGVSGGSVGIGIYLLARQELVPTDPWKDCRSGKEPSSPLTDVVAHTLVQDHLSPVISRMLGWDAPHLHVLFGEGPTRGQALLASWNSSLQSALQQRKPAAEAQGHAAFALPLSQLHGGLNPPPAVYFNAADADSGQITWFSNVAGGRVHSPQGEGASTASVGQAVLHSARFPIVTPAGVFDAPWAPGKLARRLVDGGYADNSGATTLVDAKAKDVAWSLIIDGNPTTVPNCRKEKEGYPVGLTAVRGLLQARSAHAEKAVARLKDAGNGTRSLDLTFDLDRLYRSPGQTGPDCDRIARAQQPPLGWYMSYEAAMVLLHSSRQAQQLLCQRMQLTCRPLAALPRLPN